VNAATILKDILSITKIIATDDFKATLTFERGCVTVSSGFIAAVIRSPSIDCGEGVVTWPALEVLLRNAHLVNELHVTTVQTPVTLSTVTAHMRGTVLSMVSVIERHPDTLANNVSWIKMACGARSTYNTVYVPLRPTPPPPDLPAPLRERCEVGPEVWKQACRAVGVVGKNAVLFFLEQPQPMLRLLWTDGGQSSVNVIMTLRVRDV